MTATLPPLSLVRGAAMPAGFLAAELRDEAEKRRNVYLAAVAHELRNSLAPLSSAIEVMTRCPQFAGRSEMATIARGQIRQLAVLTADLLDVGRAANDEFQMTFATVAVQDLVAGVVAPWRLLAEAKGQAIALDMPSAPVLVQADRVRFSQALQNILANAVKYTPDGGRVAVRVEGTPDEAHIYVTDSGIGITPRDMENIFELFYRADRGGAAGLGIGLPLSRQLIVAHGGTIGVTSDGTGTGTSFTIRLPRTPDAVRD